MSEENVELVRSTYEAFDRGDVDAMTATLDPHVVCYVAAPLPDAAEYHGPRGFMQWIANWVGSFERLTIEPQEFVDAGDHVIARTLQRGIGKESGVEVSQTFWFVHTFREGKAVRVGVHATQEQAREAAGL